MRYLSLFSGIEAATVAWHPLGWECAGVAEIEPFTCALLQHHYPEVPNLGSVTEITNTQIKALGPIDLVVGGSPCQDLSVAGLRAGLSGGRSGLFYEQMRIFNAARTFCGARWLLWENVPGAFSSQKGKDFAIVVGAMVGANFNVPKGRWQKAGVAVGPNGLLEWRTLDAQYVRVESHPRAVPQRRRRVFALLDTGDWADRPPVLLEPEGLRGDSPPFRETTESFTERTESGSRESRRPIGFHHNAQACQLPGPDRDTSISDSLTCSQQAAVALNIYGGNKRKDRPEGGFYVESALTSKTLDAASGLNPTCSQGGTAVLQPAVAFQEVAQPLRTNIHNNSDPGMEARMHIQHGMQVRRLTPLECERLQGFPDGWTDIPFRNKPATPGPRYKALGNSMAVNVMRWIGDRLDNISKAGTS